MFDECPVGWLRQASELGEVVDVLRFHKYHILPVAGGWLDQDPRWLEVLEIVEGVIAEVEA